RGQTRNARRNFAVERRLIRSRNRFQLGERDAHLQGERLSRLCKWIVVRQSRDYRRFRLRRGLQPEEASKFQRSLSRRWRGEARGDSCEWAKSNRHDESG